MTEDTAPDTRAAGDTRDTGAWFPALVSTLITLPLAFVAFIGVAFSPMMCNTCTRAEHAQLWTAMRLFLGGLLIPLGLLITSWALPWQERNVVRRRVVSLLAPAAVVALYVVFAMASAPVLG
ncbi:hypothetical protein ACIBCM_14330 [Streptomyces sp. NPDC051018]|uniref:hypothetical protein n=1 Tax=Streptomyces sp. NPDC051018 TaxID=3365639 RepID=UPI0037AC0F97